MGVCSKAKHSLLDTVKELQATSPTLCCFFSAATLFLSDKIAGKKQITLFSNINFNIMSSSL